MDLVSAYTTIPLKGPFLGSKIILGITWYNSVQLRFSLF